MNYKNKIEIRKILNCCSLCPENYITCIDLENGISADSGQPIDINEWIICNPVGDDIENPPRFSRAFRKKCIEVWDVYDKDGNKTRYFNDVKEHNCLPGEE